MGLDVWKAKQSPPFKKYPVPNTQDLRMLPSLAYILRWEIFLSYLVGCNVITCVLTRGKQGIDNSRAGGTMMEAEFGVVGLEDR